jgi:hypothetical protein
VAPDTREGNDEPVEIKGRRGRGRAVDSLPARRAGAQSRGSGERRRGGGRGEEVRACVTTGFVAMPMRTEGSH